MLTVKVAVLKLPDPLLSILRLTCPQMTRNPLSML